jgi:hypothetical protein
MLFLEYLRQGRILDYHPVTLDLNGILVDPYATVARYTWMYLPLRVLLVTCGHFGITSFHQRQYIS